VNNDSADKPNDEERDPIDDVMDLLVFAPIGLALELRNLLPGLAERGRRQVNFARSVGQMATKSATQPPQPKKAASESAATKKAAPKTAAKEEPDTAKPKAKPKKATAKKKAAPTAAAEKPTSKKDAAPRTATKKTAARNTAAKNTAGKKTAGKKAAAKKDPAKKAAAGKTPATKPDAEPVAVRPLREIIQNYDSMSARDIIGSLGQLTGTDLEVVRTYEAANRGRVTVLNRVNQMLKA